MQRKARYIGTAGWAMPVATSGATTSHLERYSAVFSAVEINSSFYRTHKPDTYARWADTVPDEFRFAVKVPRTVTHKLRLKDAGSVLAPFLAGVQRLGEKLGPLLVQLPPSLPFAEETVEPFLDELRDLFDGLVVLEPRHASWFRPSVEALLEERRVARCAADPCKWTAGPTPGGWKGLAYYRLHGSPVMYVSPYSRETLQGIAAAMVSPLDPSRQAWCMFDNTAQGAALGDALTMGKLLCSHQDQQIRHIEIFPSNDRQQREQQCRACGIAGRLRRIEPPGTPHIQQAEADEPSRQQKPPGP